MPGSHPRTLLKTVRQTLAEECGVARGDRVLVAVSGGGDSQALLHALSVLRKDLGLELLAHGVDHGLRADAASELDLAEQLATRLDVHFSRSKVRLSPGGNLQARARRLRYEALGQVATEHGARYIATAHHAEDRAETVLLRLLRGSGPRGLGVLPPISGNLIRPMIHCRKRDVLLHLERHALQHASDPSNGDPRFLRARVRLELLPLLEGLSPRIVEHLNALARQVQQPEASAPAVLDPQGAPVRLGRAQIEQITRARRFGLRHARIRISGTREVVLDPATGDWRVQPAAPRPPRAQRPLEPCSRNDSSGRRKGSK